MDNLTNLHASLKKNKKQTKQKKKQRKFQQKLNLLRKTGSLKSTLNVVIVIKVFYIKSVKYTKTANQLYWSKVKNVIMIFILKITLIISKTHGKELNR